MDVRFTDHGTIVLLEPLTEAAQEWVADNISPDAQTWAGSIVVEPRYVENIVLGMQDDGLAIEIE